MELAFPRQASYNASASNPSVGQLRHCRKPMSLSATRSVASFPLERPTVRVKKRDSGTTDVSLPYFIAGDENRMLAHVATSSLKIAELGNPILLVGPSGAGKTAIAMHLAAREAIPESSGDQPHSVVIYSAVDFARQYAEAVAADDLPPLRAKLNDAPILVVDDLHLIANKPAAQDELAVRIENREQRGLATILTCRKLPTEVRGMRPLLVSRVLPGLTIPIATPGEATRLQLLGEFAVHHSVEIDEPLLDQLSDQLDPRLPARGLQAAIKQIALWSRMNESAPTGEAVQAAIEVVGKREELALATIAVAVAKYYRLKLSDMRSSSRKQNLVRARSLAMLLARQLTSKSMHQIGDYFGGRDHTTVLHAIRKTESLVDADTDVARAATDVREKLSVG